jgi:predicted AAA+ superfamily ATPase
MNLPVFRREVTKTIADRLSEPRKFIQVINGPRQVGKTIAIQQVLEELDVPYHYASADFPAPPALEWIYQQWNLARMKYKKEFILVLDEIQKVSGWSEEVKHLWDEDSRIGRKIKVVLLGSSALLMQKGLSESLAGRFEIIRVSHWAWKEINDCFKWPIDKYFYFGGYPGAALLVNDEQRWSQYIRDSLIETTISKDIFLLNRIEKPSLLRQLFVLACEYGGQILSYQKLLGRLTDAGNTTTLAHYQELLESAFLIKGLPKWSGGALRRRSSSPKWLPLNTALMTSLGNISFKEWHSAPDIWGRLTEAVVGAYIVNEGEKFGIKTYYWREGNYEVDFVIQKGKKIIGIEVKSGRTKEALLGLELFKKKYKDAKTLLIGQTGVSIKDFLETPITHLFEE